MACHSTLVPHTPYDRLPPLQLEVTHAPCLQLSPEFGDVLSLRPLTMSRSSSTSSTCSIFQQDSGSELLSSPNIITKRQDDHRERIVQSHFEENSGMRGMNLLTFAAMEQETEKTKILSSDISIDFKQQRQRSLSGRGARLTRARSKTNCKMYPFARPPSLAISKR